MLDLHVDLGTVGMSPAYVRKSADGDCAFSIIPPPATPGNFDTGS